jgi:ubiquinone/menaquinone biosynthesis C-methylase UbiE
MENSATSLSPDASNTLAPDPWEAAYLRFETPEQEIRKFMSRLIRLGAPQWPRDAEIVELFCGRGNGLIALQRLGFTRVEGVDFSPRLLAQFKGSAKCTVADCRQLPFADRSKDILIVQGGLHHLPTLPGDLDQTFSEMQRVLRKNGRVMFVEPWRTPFLTFAHFISEITPVRRLSKKHIPNGPASRNSSSKSPAPILSPSTNLSPGANGISSARQNKHQQNATRNILPLLTKDLKLTT